MAYCPNRTPTSRKDERFRIPVRHIGERHLVEARVLAVADVIEAMASHRPYRLALGINKALDEISEKRCVFYDREVVGAGLKLFRELRFEFE